MSQVIRDLILNIISHHFLAHTLSASGKEDVPFILQWVQPSRVWVYFGIAYNIREKSVLKSHSSPGQIHASLCGDDILQANLHARQSTSKT